MTDTEMRDIIMNFLVAGLSIISCQRGSHSSSYLSFSLRSGRDTTAVAMSWFFYEMTLHPEIEAKVIEEIDRVLGPLPNTSATTEDRSRSESKTAHSHSESEHGQPRYGFDAAKEMVYTEACLLVSAKSVADCCYLSLLRLLSLVCPRKH